MPRLELDIEDENQTVIRDRETGEARIQIAFLGAACHLTSRVKAEIAVNTLNTYIAEANRLNSGRLGVYDVINGDGSMGKQSEMQPSQSPI